MNRVERAVADSSLAPLTIEQPTSPVSAAVMAFFAAAAFGYMVGYGLGAGELPEGMEGLDGLMLGDAAASELLAARGAAVGSRLIAG